MWVASEACGRAVAGQPNCRSQCQSRTWCLRLRRRLIIASRSASFCRRCPSTHCATGRRCCSRRPAARGCRPTMTTSATLSTTRRRSGRRRWPPTSWWRRAPNAGASTAGWSTSTSSRCRSIATSPTGCSSRPPSNSSRWRWSAKRPSARNSRLTHPTELHILQFTLTVASRVMRPVLSHFCFRFRSYNPTVAYRRRFLYVPYEGEIPREQFPRSILVASSRGRR